MDDFIISSLTESRNEYSAMLVSRLTSQIITGINSIFNEAVELCQKNDEEEKYLMTFQNFLGRVPKWNQDIVENEKERIIKSTNCSYLEDLLTCVHITQLKVLTNMRAGNKQQKIDIDIPSLSSFLHRVYIAVSRKVYKNVFLYEQNILPLQKQKNMRELELIVESCILNVIRENMPIESILRSYLDESIEENVEQIKEQVEEIFEPIQNVETETVKSDTKSENNPMDHIDDEDIKENIIDSSVEPLKIDFSDSDRVLDYDNETIPAALSTDNFKNVNAPKTIERLEEISQERALQRKLEEEDDDDYDDDYDDDDYQSDTIKIMSDVKLNDLDIHNVDDSIKLNKQELLGDIVQL